MGWSLKGILAGAGKGMADWAGREIAAEKQAERDAVQFERQKEMSRYNDELAGARKERELELTAAHEEKKSTKERARIAEAAKTIDEAAEANKLDKNTPEYFSFAAGEALRSGDAGLTKHFSDQWDKLRDDEWKREEARLRREATAAQRDATNATREADRSMKQVEADRKWEDFNMKTLEHMIPQTFITDEKGDTKRVADANAFAAARLAYQRSGNNMAFTTQAIGAAADLVRKGEVKDFSLAIGKSVDTLSKDAVRAVENRNPETRGRGILASDPSMSMDVDTTASVISSAMDQAPSAPQTPTSERLSAAAERRVNFGRGAVPGQHTKPQTPNDPAANRELYRAYREKKYGE